MKLLSALSLLIFSFVLFATFASAIVENDSMRIYAVTTDGQGLVATLHINVEPGSGKIWSAVTPLVGTSTQNAEKTAVQVAERLANARGKYDYKFTIDSDASVVDGPSAGGAMALLTYSMLSNMDIPDYVSLTGTINSDGSIGRVGGIYEKALEASKTGTKLFLIPSGEAVQTVKISGEVRSVNLLEYAPKQWGMKVAEVEKLSDALDIAHADIETLDINTSAADAIPEFVPQKIVLAQNLNEFKLLTTSYINKTRQGNAQARNAISSSLVEDPSLTQDMLSSLNAAESTAQRAEILNEQNYLYSAANFSFLAQVNATIVKMIANDPKVVDPQSTSLDLKILDLKHELDDFGVTLSGTVPKEGAEWFASAQQRYTYAKLAVDKLTTTQTIIVGGSEEENREIAFERLQNYAYALAWLGVAEEFYALAESKNYASRPPIGVIDANALIVKAEKDFAMLDENSGEAEDIERRLNSAKAAYAMKWHEAAALDAAAASALARAQISSKNLENSQMLTLLEKEISETEKMLRDSNVNVSWPQLYLDHAKYYLSSAKYYAERDLENASLADLKSGYSLALLAKEGIEPARKIISAYAALPDAVPTNGGTNGNGKTTVTYTGGNNFAFIAAIMTLTALVLILLLLLLGVLHSNRKGASISKEILELKKAMKDVDLQLISGKIDVKTHSKLKHEHAATIAKLEAERKEKATHMIAADSYATEITEQSEKLRMLREHFNKGDIAQSEFARVSAQYVGKLDALKGKLEMEINAAKGHARLEEHKTETPAQIASVEKKTETKKATWKEKSKTENKRRKGAKGRKR